MAQYFLQSIITGFRLGQMGVSDNQQRNLRSAADHLTIVDNYFHKILLLCKILGPYPPSTCPGIHINRFVAIPRNHQQDKWHFITDLSHPSGSSVNDGIPSQLCTLIYVTMDDVILSILRPGRNIMLAKLT